MPAPRFTPETLTFLRQLKANNDRAWFREHREAYETHVKRPMVELIERLAIDLPAIAPDKSLPGMDREKSRAVRPAAAVSSMPFQTIIGIRCTTMELLTPIRRALAARRVQ